MKMNFKKAKKIIHEMDDKLSENDDAFKIACILFMSVFEGPNIKRLAKKTPYSRQFISRISKNLRKNGIWKGGKVYHSGWDDKESGVVAFWLDVCAAEGYVKMI